MDGNLLFKSSQGFDPIVEATTKLRIVVSEHYDILWRFGVATRLVSEQVQTAMCKVGNHVVVLLLLLEQRVWKQKVSLLAIEDL